MKNKSRTFQQGIKPKRKSLDKYSSSDFFAKVRDKHIVLGVTGSIAAYKAADLVSKLKQAGFDVYVIMTENAKKLVGPATFRAISGNPVLSDMFPKDEEALPHIRLAEWMNLFIIVPATANIIGKIAHGIADDLLSTTVIATRKPVLIAPAMNEKMYLSKIVQENLNILRKRGYDIIEPEKGFLACGYKGKGRLADINKIITKIKKQLNT